MRSLLSFALALLCGSVVLVGCADNADTDPFRRIVVSDRAVFVLTPGGGIAQVSRPRELREDPETTFHPVVRLDGLGVTVDETLWYSDGLGIGTFDPERTIGDAYVSIQRLLGLPEYQVALWSITSLDSFRDLLWIGLAPPPALPDEDGLPVANEPSLLVSLDIRTVELTRLR